MTDHASVRIDKLLQDINILVIDMLDIMLAKITLFLHVFVISV